MAVIVGGLFNGWPFEWILGLILAIFIPIIIILMLLAFRRKDTGPDEEDMLALPVIDEHGTIQEGPLIGNLDRTEDELLVPVPNWQDSEDPNQTPVFPVDISQKVPIPVRTGDGKLKRLWIGRDKGHIDIVSASTLVSEKIPKRWDLPLVDPRRIFRHLEGARQGSSITNALTTKTGIITLLGIFFMGGLTIFFIVTASGHLR